MDICSPVNAVHDNFISHLESTFSESLHIQDAQKSEHASEGDDDCNVREGNLRGGFEQQETKLNIQCKKKCSTFPYPDMMLPPSSSDEEPEEADTSLTESLSEQSPHQSYSCSVSLPAPPKQETKLNMKCKKKCSTFPYPDMMLPPSSSDEESEEADASLAESLSEQSPHQSYSCSVSLPSPLKQETKLNMEFKKKCSAFPYPDMMLPPSSSDEEPDEADTSLTESLFEQSPHQSHSCSLSLLAPSKLVSAMKGSREKQGGSKIKLTVTWAPDVYDPEPTVLSDIVKSNKQQKSRKEKIEKSEKKNGKKAQKSNYSKGGSGKDKKQYRKLGGNSDVCYRWLDSRDKVIDSMFD